MSKKNITPINGAESTLADSITNAVSVQGNLKEFAAEIKRQDTKVVADKYFSTARKVGYICECGNGTGDNGTGAEIYFNTHHNRHELKCQKCGRNFNNLEIIAYGEKLDLDDKKDFAAAVKIGCHIYGLNFGAKYINAPKNLSVNLPTNDNAAELKMIHDDIGFAQGYLAQFNQDMIEQGRKLNIRGLIYDTLNFFGCGYIDNWISPKIRLEVEQGKRTKLPPSSRRFIVPTANHYNAVMSDLDREYTDKKYHKMHAGTKEIFGADFLGVNTDLIIVVEGEFDAMSIWQATDGKLNVIATGGAADKRVINFLQTKFTEHKPNILILFDSDDAGRLNAPKLCDQLLKIGFCTVFKFLSDENSKVDANQILQEQGDEKLAEIISLIVADAQADFVAIKENFETIRADDGASDKNFSADAQIDSLKIELQEVNKKLSDFEQEKSAAIEKLRNAETFSKDFVFTDEILTAAAFAKIYNREVYSNFKAAIQNQIKSQGTEKFINDWSGAVGDRITDIKNRKSELVIQQKSINAKITSLNFVAKHDELKDFAIPEGYEISANGIEKIVGEKFVTVSRVPAFIQAKRKNFEEKTFKFVLAYLSENGKWQNIPAASASTVFNSRKLIDLSDYGLPVTSTNANLFVDFLDAFKAVNEKILPMSLNVSRCGWYNFGDKDYFVEPRRKCFIADDERNIEIVVDDSSTFAKSLKSVGSLSEWTKAYEIVKKSPVARLIVAASVAAPLLKILGERNFMLYIHARTLAGKSTALKFAASAVGDDKIIRSFDATKNGLAGAAADVNDYVFMIDEKQVADNRLKEQLSNLVYALANGVGRTKLNKDSTLKKLQDWRTIIIANGETPLLDDNTTGGAFSRLLSIRAPKKILAADDCKTIKDIIENNYGHALPLVVDEFFKYGFDNLRDLYQTTAKTFSEKFPILLNEYCRYMAVMTVADTFLNMSLGVEENQAYSDALDNAKEIFTLIPTLDEISDIEREKDFVLGFIAAKSAQFEGTLDFIKGRDNLGKFKDDFVYITARALKQACTESNFDYKKVYSDLIDAKFFIADDKPKKGRKNPNSCVDEKINGITTKCYRIPNNLVVGND